jgi:hypothetical protein
MNPSVLILSGLYDFSADLVCMRLRELNVEFIRLNRESLSAHAVTLDPIKRVLSIEGPAGNALVGPGLRSIWFRQPVFLRNTPPQPLSVEEQLARSQWSAFQRSLSVFDTTSWMNHPQATYLAESKPYQLSVAQRCGLPVLDTLITNCGRAIGERFSGPLVVKSLDTVLLREGEDCLFTYTTVADVQALSSRDFREAPLLAQAEAVVKADLRVTVIGDMVYAVRILATSGAIKGDWRLVPREQLRYEDVELPPAVRQACLRLTSDLGLSFAAIDLMETVQGVVFVEVNPTGEWGWIASKHRPIDLTIAQWLSGQRP